MSRIKPVLETTHDGVRRSFNAIERQLGVVPNMMRTMAQSPRVLEGYLAISGALSRGLLPATLQEQIALAVAETNACNYCLSAHTAWVVRQGCPTTSSPRAGKAGPRRRKRTPRCTSRWPSWSTAAVSATSSLARVRAAGFSDAEITEIIAHIALNVLTNYFNRAADTEIDFPKVAAAQLV